MRVHPLIAALLGLASLGSLAAEAGAQERLPIRGRVVTVDRAPWAGASVTLIGGACPWRWDVGASDRVTAMTGDDGRFEAALLPYRHYSAWAHGMAVNGVYRLTRIAEDVVAFAPVTLVERELRQPTLRVRIEREGDAEPFGPLAWELRCRAPRQVLVQAVEPDERGEIVLPPLPPTRGVSLVARTAAGVEVFQQYVATVPRDGEVDVVRVVRLPAPKPIRFEVKSRATGEPVVGAAILVGTVDSSGSIGDRRSCREIARTDAAGMVTVPLHVAWDEDGSMRPPLLDLIVRAEGHADALFSMLRGLGKGDATSTRDDPVARVDLASGHAVSARILAADGEPAAGVPVLVYASVGAGNRTSRTISSEPTVVRTDADGRFRVPGRSASLGYRITTLVDVAEGGGREECYLHAAAPLPTDQDVDLGDLAIADLVRVEVAVLTDDGGPAGQTRLYIGELGPGTPNTPVTYLTDHVGRCALRVRGGSFLALFAAHESGFALERLDVTAEPVRVDLRLRVATTIAGRVTDPDGQPIAGARVRVRGAAGVGAGAWFRYFLGAVSSTTRALDYRTILTDRDGGYRVPFPFTDLRVSASCWLREIDGTYWEMRGDARELELADEPLADVDFVLERRAP